MKLVILAGGSGSRLWPISRKTSPKQVKPILGKETLLSKTYRRLRQGFAKKHIYVATNQAQLGLIKDQLPDFPKDNFILESAKRDTAAAIGLAAVYLHKENPREVMMNINSDHYIENEKEYLRVIRLAEKAVKKKPQSGLLIGVNPTYPETGYGYIKMGDLSMEISKDKIFRIDRFEEKPDKKTALKYMESWEYLWNLGCFVFRVDTLLDLYRRYLPRTHIRLMRIKDAIGTASEEAVLKREFSRIKAISIDYGIIERAPGLQVLPADFGWADVGNWRAVKDILSQKKKRTIKKGKIISVDSENNLLYNFSDKLVAAIGVKDMVFIETEDAVLLCPHDRAQDIKKIVAKLKLKKNLNKYL